MMKKFNVNQWIGVKLTNRAKDIYYHRYDEINKLYGKEVIKPSYPDEDENGFTAFQLWDFMSLYGPYIIMGTDILIEKNYVYIDEKYLEEE